MLVPCHRKLVNVNSAGRENTKEKEGPTFKEWKTAYGEADHPIKVAYATLVHPPNWAKMLKMCSVDVVNREAKRIKVAR
jgi:hypothetical protein